MTAPPAERVGRYQLLDPIGVGPSGEVSRAKVFGVAGFERQFAVKRFHADVTASQPQAQALSAAARAYGSLEHPRIARMSEFGVAKGTTFTAVEYVVGLDALKLVTEARLAGTTLATGGALALVSQAARAIGFAHGRGLTHLGLAPTNVIVTAEGDLKITDFGICAATLPAGALHTEVARLANRVAYLAPEQLLGEATSAATDVFALGVLAYELVTGTRAFRGASPGETIAAVLAGPPEEPQLPRPIARVILRCMTRSPFERFPDARAFADALDAAIRLAPVPGTRKDIGAQVGETLDRMAALREGEQSGMLAFNIGTGPTPKLPPSITTLGRDLGNAPVATAPPIDASATQPELARPLRTMPGLAPPPMPVPPMPGSLLPPGAAASGLAMPPGSRATSHPPSAPQPIIGAPKFPLGPASTIVGQPMTKPLGPRTAPMLAQLPTIPLPARRLGTDLEVPIEKSGRPPRTFDPTDQLARTLKDTDIELDDLELDESDPPAPPSRPPPPPSLHLPKRPSAPPVPAAAAQGPSRPEPQAESTTLGMGFDGAETEPYEVLTEDMAPHVREKLDEASVVPTSEIDTLVRGAYRDAARGLDDPGAPLEAPPNTLLGLEPARATTIERSSEPPQVRPVEAVRADEPPRRNTLAWVAGIVLGAGALAGGAWFAYQRLHPNPTVATNGTAIVFRDAAGPRLDAAQVAVLADAGALVEAEYAVDAAGIALAVTPDAAALAVIPDAVALAVIPDAVALAILPDAAAPTPDAAPQVVVQPGSGLSITSVPPGAHVFLDGADVGVTPLSLAGSPAEHAMAVALSGYDLVLQKIAGTGAITVPLAAIPPWVGDAGIKVLRCKANRYFVSVDNKPTGMLCPTERINTVVGPHSVDVYDLVAQTHRKYDIHVPDTRLSVRVRVETD